MADADEAAADPSRAHVDWWPPATPTPTPPGQAIDRATRSATAITEAVDNDLVRGVMATDALIGTFARTDDPSLLQNVCFLYHLLGGGTGDWDVPIGGMGAVSGALAAAASGHGAESSPAQRFTRSTPDGEVRYRHDGGEHRVARAIRAGRRDPDGAGRAARRAGARRRRRARR